MGIIRNIFVEKLKFVSRKKNFKDAIQFANSGQTCWADMDFLSKREF